MTGKAPTRLSELLILDGAVEPDRVDVSAGGGLVVAMTSRDPEKDTENEDTVAVIPFGPEAVVLVVADGNDHPGCVAAVGHAADHVAANRHPERHRGRQ